MKEIILLAIVISLCVNMSWAQSSPGQEHSSPDNNRWQISASADYLTGGTSYSLEVLARFPGTDSIREIASILDFQLDIVEFGLQVSWRSPQAAERPWMLEVGVSTNLHDPSAKLLNRDWIDDQLISYTMSRSELQLLRAQAAYHYGLKKMGNTEFRLLSRLSYLSTTQEIFGFAGWYLNLFDGEKNPINDTEQSVIDYQLHAMSLFLGGAAEMPLGKSFKMEVECYGGPIYAQDKDHHILRAKEATAKTWGYSIGIQGKLVMQMAFAKRLPISIFTNYQYFHSYGTQSVLWNEEGNSVQAGTEVSGIPYEIYSSQLAIGLAISYML